MVTRTARAEKPIEAVDAPLPAEPGLPGAQSPEPMVTFLNLAPSVGVPPMTRMRPAQRERRSGSPEPDSDLGNVRP